MKRYLLKGAPPIEIRLRRSHRARRMTLRISQLDGQVTLTLPHFAREDDVERFVTTQEAWLRNHLAAMGPAVCVSQTMQVMLRGQLTQIVADATKRPYLQGDILFVRQAKPIGPQAKAVLQTMARDALSLASDRYAKALGVTYQTLSLRDPRSRWGSCSSAGRLMYSWRLIMAPPDVLDYVAAHEVAHLVEMNHRPAFWAVVADLCPNYQVHRSWLQSNGAPLHRYLFDD